MLLPIACPEVLPYSARAGRSRVVRRKLSTALCHSPGEGFQNGRIPGDRPLA